MDVKGEPSDHTKPNYMISALSLHVMIVSLP
jgi:hypothetical protein